MTEPEILAFLDTRDIHYQRIEHDPVFTVEDTKKMDTGLTGLGTKNLFLRDKKGRRLFLVVVEKTKQTDMKKLVGLLNADRLSFAGPDRLYASLGVRPGSVTILSVVNDPDNQVELFVDEDVWSAPSITCHPLVNTATIELSHDGLVRFLAAVRKRVSVIAIPRRLLA